MKRIIKCEMCEEYTPYYRSYKVKIEKSVMLAPGMFQKVEREGRICRKCAKGVGYKVKKEKGEKA